jgi:hypothetical protein
VLQFADSQASAWNVSAAGTGLLVIKVGREDTVVGGAFRNGTVTVSIDVDPDVNAAVCAALTYPNEANAPIAARVPVSFDIYAPLGFTSPSVNVELTFGGNVYSNESCAYTAFGLQNRTYSCNVSMNYWYAPGDYDLNITYVDLGNTTEISLSDECGYGQLLAGVRTEDAVAFPTGGPGISNAPGTPVISVLNTGNVQFVISITAYDLSGRSSPSNKLAASAFKAGASLGSSVVMAHGIEKNLSMSIAPAQGASDDVGLWLSMPVDQLVQDYYAATPWQMYFTG